MGEDKFAVNFRGKQLLDHVLDLCKEINASEVIVVGNEDQQVRGKFQFVQDEMGDVGPLGGILTGIQNASYELNLVLPCDTPFVNANLLQSMLSKESGQKVVVPSVNGKLHPTVGIYKKELTNDLRKFLIGGNRKMMDFIRSVNGLVLSENELLGLENNTFINLNSQKELKENEH
jgi:molybdopterin-guanine dinucleotide biosynthesis protein A